METHTATAHKPQKPHAPGALSAGISGKSEPAFSIAKSIAARCDKGYYVAQSVGDDYHEEQERAPQFTVENNGQVMFCNVIRSRNGHVSLRGSLNGEERLQCDMTTTYGKHPDRFAKECREVALNRLRQIQTEGKSK